MPETTPQPEAKTFTANDLTALAHDYHVPISKGTINQMTDETGAVSPEKHKAFEEYIKTTAQGLFPTFAPQIKAGIPTAYLLDPYRQIAKQTLGDHVEPDFHTESKWSAALHGGTNPETGRPAPLSLDQWKQHLMDEPSFGWGQTPQAHERVNMIMDTMAKGLGVGQGNN